jgi:VanZ family protein
LWPFNFLQSNQASWESEGGLRFVPPATAYTPTPPAKLSGLQEWTILIDAQALPPRKVSRIFSYSLDEHQYNLNIDQVGNDLLIRVRTGSKQRSREVYVENALADRRFVLALVYDGSALSVFVDGDRKARERVGAIDPSTWDEQYPLVLASRTDGTWCWQGIFYRLAIVPRAIDPDSLTRGAWAPDDAATVSYRFDERAGVSVIDHGRRPPAPIACHERFIPYKRTVLQAVRDYFPGPRPTYFRDIFANLLIYLPIGFLILALVRQHLSLMLSVLSSILGALSFSLVIEVLQAYLATRNSSTVDVIMNGMGACIGVWLQQKGWVERLLIQLNIRFRKVT